MLPGPDTTIQQQTGADSLSQIPIYDDGQIPIYSKRCRVNVKVWKVSMRKVLAQEFYSFTFTFYFYPKNIQ